MQARFKSLLTVTLLLLLAALCFTVVVRTVDVQAIGPLSSEVGLAALNRAAADTFGAHSAWDALTDGILAVTLLTALCFAAAGLWQALRRKSLTRIDPGFWCLGGTWALTAGVYVFFELFPVNFRPVLEEELEASYPSSHVLFTCCILATAAVQLPRLVKSRRLQAAFRVFAVALILLQTVGRMLAGVHWLTDVLGGLIFAAALLFVYLTALSFVTAPRLKHAR